MVAETVSIFKIVEIFVNLLTHISIAFNTIFLSWFFMKSGLTNISLHAWLCTIGYHFLMAEAILCLSASNSWSSVYSRATKKTQHWILQVIGCALGLGGTIVAITLKGSHFDSIHGILGLASGILLLIGLITGLCSLYAQNIPFNAALNKSFHNFLGLAAYIIGLVSLYYGYDKGFIYGQLPLGQVNILKAFTILTIILTSWSPLMNLFRQTKNVINS